MRGRRRRADGVTNKCAFGLAIPAIEQSAREAVCGLSIHYFTTREAGIVQLNIEAGIRLLWNEWFRLNFVHRGVTRKCCDRWSRLRDSELWPRLPHRDVGLAAIAVGSRRRGQFPAARLTLQISTSFRFDILEPAPKA